MPRGWIYEYSTIFLQPIWPEAGFSLLEGRTLILRSWDVSYLENQLYKNLDGICPSREC